MCELGELGMRGVVLGSRRDLNPFSWNIFLIRAVAPTNSRFEPWRIDPLRNINNNPKNRGSIMRMFETSITIVFWASSALRKQSIADWVWRGGARTQTVSNNTRWRAFSGI